jgi:hypothetical protein
MRFGCCFRMPVLLLIGTQVGCVNHIHANVSFGGYKSGIGSGQLHSNRTFSCDGRVARKPFVCAIIFSLCSSSLMASHFNFFHIFTFRHKLQSFNQFPRSFSRLLCLHLVLRMPPLQRRIRFGFLTFNWTNIERRTTYLRCYREVRDVDWLWSNMTISKIGVVCEGRRERRATGINSMLSLYWDPPKSELEAREPSRFP